jgi:anti-anti-sigma factor
MSTVKCNTINTVLFNTDKTAELVRGHDEDLMRRVSPLVRQRDVSLDLGNVQRIDAAGIAALISLYGHARETGHTFTVENASPRVAEILTLVGLDRILLSQNAVTKSHSAQFCERPAA